MANVLACFALGVGILLVAALAVTGSMRIFLLLHPENWAEPPDWVQYTAVAGIAFAFLLAFVLGSYQIGCSILHPNHATVTCQESYDATHWHKIPCQR